MCSCADSVLTGVLPLYPPWRPQVWKPTHVTALSKVAAIKGGEQHTLVLQKDGSLLSFGAGTYGMLGR